MILTPIYDLHCDLLLYLTADPNRSAYDRKARCSLPELKEGGVFFQTLALFSEGDEKGLESVFKQVQAYKRLLSDESKTVIQADRFQFENMTNHKRIMLAAALENAGSLFKEGESLKFGFNRLDTILSEIGPLIYASLTWNGENRFGGGAWAPEIGLKADGKEFILFLDEKNIALDLSHASDLLALEALDFIDQKGLELPVIASHSNSRNIHNAARNLPLEFFKRIISRKGLIGLNFVRHFVSENSFSALADHLEFFLSHGGEDFICFGADFFYDDDLPTDRKQVFQEWFFQGFDSSSCYPKVLSMLQKKLHLSSLQMEKIANFNAHQFLLDKIFRKDLIEVKG